MKAITEQLIQRIISLDDAHFLQFFINAPKGILIEERTSQPKLFSPCIVESITIRPRPPDCY